MIKIVLICVVIGLQNPPPSGGEHSQPEKQQAESKQPDSTSANAITNVAPTVANLGSPASQQGRGETANDGDNKSAQEGWFSPIWVAIYVSAFTSLVGIAQFVMYWRQWCMMRKALVQTESISRRTLKHSKESSERGLRAYVNPVMVAYNSTDLGQLVTQNSYLLTVENSGQTPAHDLSSCATWDYVKGAPGHWLENKPFKGVDEIEAEKPNRGTRMALASKHRATFRCLLIEHTDGTSFSDAMALAMDRKVTVFIYGTITYQDVFDKRRYTNFCTVTSFFVENQINFSTYDLHAEAT